MSHTEALQDATLRKKEVTFPSTNTDRTTTEIRALLAQPANTDLCGSVLVVFEIFGLTDHIKDVTCRLAQAGFNALGVDLFTREGAPPSLTGGFEPLRQFVSAIPDSQIMNDLDAASAFLRSLSESNEKIGIVGFCWGGRVSMLYDAHSPKLNAAVAYYGRINGDPTPNQPAHPIDVVEKFHAPLLGNFGALDGGIPPSHVEQLRTSMQAHNKPGEIYEYEGAGHAFNNDTREAYNPAASQLAWQRTLDWFKHHLG